MTLGCLNTQSDLVYEVDWLEGVLVQFAYARNLARHTASDMQYCSSFHTKPGRFLEMGRRTPPSGVGALCHGTNQWGSSTKPRLVLYWPADATVS